MATITPPVSFSARELRAIHRVRILLERTLRGAGGLVLDNPGTARLYLQTRFAGLDHEQAHALYLDTQNRLLAAQTHAIGSIHEAAVYPREIARAALRHNASAVIFAHNHPSGNAKPSRADIMLTDALRNALALVGVRLLDHMIVAGPTVASCVAEVA